MLPCGLICSVLRWSEETLGRFEPAYLFLTLNPVGESVPFWIYLCYEVRMKIKANYRRVDGVTGMPSLEQETFDDYNRPEMGRPDSWNRSRRPTRCSLFILVLLSISWLRLTGSEQHTSAFGRFSSKYNAMGVFLTVPLK